MYKQAIQLFRNTLALQQRIKRSLEFSSRLTVFGLAQQKNLKPPSFSCPQFSVWVSHQKVMGAIFRRAQVVCILALGMANGAGPLRKGTSLDPIRCAIFISGSGSGMEAMVRYQQESTDCAHQTVLVLSDQPDALGLQRASNLGVESVCVPLPAKNTNSHERRLLHEQTINPILERYDVELILLSGYMRLVSAPFVEHWSPRIVNIHPSLLPSFPGAHAHRDVLASGVKVSGCTVHYVDAGMDTGEVLGQRRVPVFASDDESTLAERVKIEERLLYPEIIDRIVK